MIASAPESLARVSAQRRLQRGGLIRKMIGGLEHARDISTIAHSR
jgi:hypothetical protein